MEVYYNQATSLIILIVVVWYLLAARKHVVILGKQHAITILLVNGINGYMDYYALP
jgi:hypothetical protein